MAAVIYAMYKVGIIDTDYNQIKDYEEPGYICIWC